MIRLEQALADFQRQVIQSLLSTGQQSTAASLRAERVKLCLELEAKEVQAPSGKASVSFLVCASRPSPTWSHGNGAHLPDPAGAGKHTVEIEFVLSQPELAKSSPASNPHLENPVQPDVPNTTQATSGASSLVMRLSAVLGAPGFDSSARASTLREVLQSLPEEKISELVASLKLPPGTALEPGIARASHFLRGILLSGPVKSIASGSDLLEKLLELHSIESISRCLETEWKGQEHWI